MGTGLVLGLAMGISSDFLRTSVHAHLPPLGWATMSLTGIVYLPMPGCGGSRLATLHFGGHNPGLPVMMASLTLSHTGTRPRKRRSPPAQPWSLSRSSSLP